MTRILGKEQKGGTRQEIEAQRGHIKISMAMHLLSGRAKNSHLPDPTVPLHLLWYKIWNPV